MGNLKGPNLASSKGYIKSLSFEYLPSSFLEAKNSKGVFVRI